MSAATITEGAPKPIKPSEAPAGKLDRGAQGIFRGRLQEANFAVVALLAKTILTATDGSASQWAGKSMGEELFDQRSAGELFFKRLELCGRTAIR